MDKQCVKDKIKVVMREYKKKKLHSGKTNKIVKKPKQAIAIAINVANKTCKK